MSTPLRIHNHPHRQETPARLSTLPHTPSHSTTYGWVLEQQQQWWGWWLWMDGRKEGRKERKMDGWWCGWAGGREATLVLSPFSTPVHPPFPPSPHTCPYCFRTKCHMIYSGWGREIMDKTALSPPVTSSHFMPKVRVLGKSNSAGLITRTHTHHSTREGKTERGRESWRRHTYIHALHSI